MRIYISGKITGLDYNEAWHRFEATELALKQEGFEVINPMRIVKGMPADTSWKTYMKIVVPYIFDCDAIYLLNNWPGSRGAKIERQLAIGLSLVLLTEYSLQPGEIKAYLNDYLKAYYPHLINEN